MNRLKSKTAATGQLGFTLVEVMIVVAIVAILASIAIPSYRQHIIKTNRGAAESFMLQVANKEEQVILDFRLYVSVATNADFPNTPNASPSGLNMTVPPDVSRNYTLGIVANNAATPARSATSNLTNRKLACGTNLLRRLSFNDTS